VFRSFYLAGFECTTGYNLHRQWIDQVVATEHDVRVEQDYELLRSVGIQTVRECARWPLIDRRGRYDFSSLQPFLEALRRYSLEPIWDLFHYGYPEDLDPFEPRFAQRFADYCGAVVRHICRELPGPYYFTPINEASYFSWAAGEVGRFAPHTLGRGYELKVCLARAALLAIARIREACPSARIVTVDPICNVVSPKNASRRARDEAAHFNDKVVFQFMDMLCGRQLPELGGSRACLDIVGLNYYWTNQWELGKSDQALAPDDPRRMTLGALVRRVVQRYGGDVLVSETAALGSARADWIDELSRTALELKDAGVELSGICLYPVVGMPEWHERGTWVPMGLWDLLPERGNLDRHPHLPALEALRSAQQQLEELQGPHSDVVERCRKKVG